MPEGCHASGCWEQLLACVSAFCHPPLSLRDVTQGTESSQQQSQPSCSLLERFQQPLTGDCGRAWGVLSPSTLRIPEFLLEQSSGWQGHSWSRMCLSGALPVLISELRSPTWVSMAGAAPDSKSHQPGEDPRGESCSSTPSHRRQGRGWGQSSHTVAQERDIPQGRSPGDTGWVWVAAGLLGGDQGL